MRYLLDNLGLKLVSLALACVLWFVIAGEKSSEMGLEVPVELQNFPRELELTGDAVTQVEVRLRASPGIIQQVEKADVAARIDLAGASEGERIVHLSADSIRVPFGVTVVRINPSIITLNFERTLQKAVPVRPRVTGRPSADHEVAEVTAEPAQVTVAGPKSRVQEIESAFTEPVSVEAATANVSEAVGVGLEDPLLRVEGGSRVRVTARVREMQETRVFDGLGVEARGRPARTTPGRVSVTVAGPASQVRALKASDVRAFVSVPSEGAATRRVPVAVEIAPEYPAVSATATRPAEVAVRPSGQGEKP